MVAVASVAAWERKRERNGVCHSICTVRAGLGRVWLGLDADILRA